METRGKTCAQIETMVIDKNRSREGIMAKWKKSGEMDGKTKERETDGRHISKIYPQADHGESPVVHHGEIR